LENFKDSEDINRAWENIEEDIKPQLKKGLCLYKMQQYKPWFDEECLGF